MSVSCFQYLFYIRLFADYVYCCGFQRKAVFSQGWAGLCVAQGQSDTLTHSRSDVQSSHSRKSSSSAEMNECVVLKELCVSSLRVCTCSASNITRCRSQTGTQQVEGVPVNFSWDVLSHPCLK